ncbi:hypothetical protein BN2476_350008 [Paraburkholderia piptadeniae]|uniref:Uncharacterized protein n=1 Tax=Paraburkholderia piptadeniae TaxID=1701573 RepID=A0A1N7S7E5_9BURK|nr:hypothetical protein BN2476_350008 [Paraburkholderia piptadeniae]
MPGRACAISKIYVTQVNALNQIVSLFPNAFHIMV